MPIFGGGSGAGGTGSGGGQLAAGFTASDLVEETRRHLLSGQEEQVNLLNNDLDASTTNFTVLLPLASITQGAIVAIDLEEIRVFTTDSNQGVTRCQRGVNGTTAAAHTAGALITVRPKFSNFRILNAINEELADLSSPSNGMFQVMSVDLTYNAAVMGYDITGATDVIRILEARYRVPGPSNNWPLIREYSVQRNMPTTTWPSGFVFDTYQRAYPGLPIHLQYASSYGQFAAMSDDIAAVAGLQLSARDIPPMGAAVRLTIPREIKRNFTEAGVEPRRADEVPSGAVLRSMLGLQQLRQTRIKAEAEALNQRYPILLPAR